MTTKQWYQNVKGVLPQEFARFMDHEFPNWKREAIAEPEDFCNRVCDFIDEHIGKSARDPLSIKVYAVMQGKSEGEVYEDFIKRGYA